MASFKHAFWAGLILVLSSGVACGHDPFEGTAIAYLRADRMELQITLARATAISLCAVITGRRVLADPADFEETRAVFAACAPAIYAITAGTNALAARATNVVVTAEADVEFRLVYPRPPAGPLEFKAVYLDKLPREGYGAMLTVLDMVNRTVLGQQLLTVGNSAMDVTVQAPASASSSDSGTARVPAEQGACIPASAPRPSLRAFLKLGVEHILTGYDHLLFLCALLVACRRFSSMLVIVSCFSLAHSITLAVAALNLVTISIRIVEPLALGMVGRVSPLRAGRPQTNYGAHLSSVTALRRVDGVTRPTGKWFNTKAPRPSLPICRAAVPEGQFRDA